MIEIITSSGVSLDLSPDAEFEVDFENPIFADDRMPVAFSTQIAFPPTQTNMLVFGFLPGSLNLPANKNINVTIFASGIPLFVGKIVFDGFEDDMMQYTFSGTDLAGSFENMDIADFAPRINLTEERIEEIQSGSDSRLKAPLLINSENLTTPIYDSIDGGYSGCYPEGKYANLPIASCPSLFIPAISLDWFFYAITSQTGLTVIIDDTLNKYLQATHILGQYKPEVSDGAFGIDASSDWFKSYLPDITVYDFFVNVMKMFCCGLFRDGSGFRMLPLSALINSNSVIDFDKVVEDVLPFVLETASSYEFGYSNETENTYSDKQLTEDLESGAVIKVIDPYSIFDIKAYEPAITASAKYYSIEDGCVYSSTYIRCSPVSFTGSEGESYTGSYHQIVVDALYRPVFDVMCEAEGVSENTINAKTDFKLVKCIPERPNIAAQTTPAFPDPYIAPVIEFGKPGSARGKDVYIGVISNNDMSDSGLFFNRGEFNYAENSGLSLRPQDLFDTWHASFAKWLAKDRLCVTAELNLPLPELANLRLYNKVFFRGRVWLIKKLSLRLSVKTDSVSVEGEFVTV